MTREEMLREAKPILFNTEMVRAVARAEDPKKATRRAIPWKKIRDALESPARKRNPDIPDEKFIRCLVDAPCGPGDILYVRETFRPLSGHPESGFEYAADWSPRYFENSRRPEACNGGRWKPSIHMPKKAARIFLRVAEARAERLSDMTLTDFIMEGVTLRPEAFNDPENACRQAEKAFRETWDGTVRKPELPRYGWDADPWVWAIEFARIYPEDGEART